MQENSACRMAGADGGGKGRIWRLIMVNKSEQEKQAKIFIQKEIEFRQLGYLVFSCYDTVLLGQTMIGVQIPSTKLESTNPFKYDAQLWFISSLNGIYALLSRYKNKHQGYKKLYDSIESEIKWEEIVRIRNYFAHFEKELANSLKPEKAKSINVGGVMTLTSRGADLYASAYFSTPGTGMDYLICGTMSVKKCVEIFKLFMIDIINASMELQIKLLQEEKNIVITMPNSMVIHDWILQNSFEKMIVKQNSKTINAYIPTRQGKQIAISFSEVVSVLFK
jgi:hypothetical protein